MALHGPVALDPSLRRFSDNGADARGYPAGRRKLKGRAAWGIAHARRPARLPDSGQLTGIPQANVGAVLRFFMPDVTGIATPIRSGGPGFIGRGLTSGGLPEFVVPNVEIHSLEFALERLALLAGVTP